jgi:hypothetical protein
MMPAPDLQLNQDDDAQPMRRLASGTVVVGYADAPNLPPGPVRPQGVAFMAWSVAKR